MQVSQLRAEPDARGGRIILSWTNPSDAGFAGVKILRRETSHPVLADIGTAVEIRDVSAAASPAGTTVRMTDDGLKPETVFYYAAVAYDAVPVFSPPVLASAMSTAPYHTALHLYYSLPAVYRNFDLATPPDVQELEPQDRARGQLSRFIDMFGLQFDLMRSFASGTLDFHAVPRVDGTLLPLLSSWVGWQHNSALDLDKQRNEIRYSPHFYRTTGIAANLRATINRLVTWDARIKEFVHSVFLSTHPEQLTISERQHRDGAFQPPQVATLDVAYEGKPAPLHTADNRDWLFYHARQSAPLAAPPTASSEAIRAKSSSKDFFHIWFKIHEQDEWEASRRVTDGDGVNKHPTAIEDGEGRIWLFWTSYSTDGELGPSQVRLALVSAGRSQRPARVRSTNRAPFTFAEGDRLRVVVVDGSDSFTRDVTFHTEHFSNIANATAEETASLLDSEIPGVDVTADKDGSIVLTSHATGAGAELQFPASSVATEVGFAGSATGTNATAAQLAGSRAEPFGLADGNSLSIKVDGRRPRIITFRTTDFVDITQATAAEVVAVINRVVPGVASVAANRVNLRSTSSGGASTLVAEVFAPLLFSLSNTFVPTLDAATLSQTLRDALDAGGLKLLADATIRVVTAGSVWLVMNAGGAFQIRNEGGPLNVYGRDLGEAALGFGAALPASTPIADDCEPSAFREAGNVWLFWSSRRNGRWKIWYNRCPLGAPVWETAKILTTGTESDREPSAMFVAGAGGRIWVFWSRKKANELWNIFLRTTTNLDFDALVDADWDEEELTPVPADYDNREPACILQPLDGAELFFTSNRNDGWHLWTKGVTPAAQGADTRLTTGQFTHRAPAAVRISDQLRKLFFRTNESQTYTSQLYPAAQTVDERYSGSTALDTRNAAKIGQRKNFPDSQRYTYDTLKGEDNWYARDTVGIYLTPDTIDQALVVRRRNQIGGVLREFLPIQVRTVFVIDQVIVEFFYTYDDPAAAAPSLIGEQMIDTIIGEVFPNISDELIGDTADFLWLHTFDAEHISAVLPDLGVVPPDLTFRLPLGGVGEGEPGE